MTPKQRQAIADVKKLHAAKKAVKKTPAKAPAKKAALPVTVVPPAKKAVPSKAVKAALPVSALPSQHFQQYNTNHKLKPCPFCKLLNTVKLEDRMTSRGYYIRCFNAKCMACGPVAGTELGALLLWNV